MRKCLLAALLGLLACEPKPKRGSHTESLAPKATSSHSAPDASSRATASTQPAAPAASAGAIEHWTAGIVHQSSERRDVATLTTLRFARHEGFDRVVFEFDGAGLPGRHVEYIDKPVRRCGSGDPTPIAGDAWLAVTLEPAIAHTEAGQPTLPARELRPDLHILREIEVTCDFEAQVTIVFGVTRPNHYKVLELSSPPRLVVDIRHQ